MLSPLEAAVPVSVRSPRSLMETFGMFTPYGLFCTHPPSAYSQPAFGGHPLKPDEPVGRSLEMPEAFASIIRFLPRSEADACRLLYFDGKSLGEAAETLGCTKGYVCRLHSNALARLRHEHAEALAG